MGNRGKREFIQVLRLMEVFSEVIVATAALDAIHGDSLPRRSGQPFCDRRLPSLWRS
jgi:hypothetical protein